MAEIALRSYNQEVQDLIDHGHLDEAIAHCQQILARYPKHAETYRLLGKAYLEQGRHADAADIFQRVLSAIPDDFLSHVAMAIMREDSGNLDAAIWHMERAHEVNPSNPTVQQEVRRLRGRRDGVEPARLRLTRAALARMYIKGGFFAQAVAEIRAALEEDADRPDLQVMLASALAQSGQAAEAGEICNTVLAKLPYCVEANQILGQILWRVGRKPEAQEVFRRLSLLDPYRGVRPPTEDGRMPEVPAGAVTLTRLTWEPGIPTGSQPPPGWKEGLGLARGEGEGEGEESKIPEWLETTAPGSTQTPFVQDTEGGLEPAPDWLSEAGGSGLAVSADGAQALLGPDEPETSLAAAEEDIPDWLRQTPVEKKSEAAKGAFPDWLMPEGSTEAKSKDVGVAPEWLKAAEQDAGLSVPGEGLPGWVGHDEPDAEPLPLAQPAERLPGWMRAEAPEPSSGGPTQEFPELSATSEAAPRAGAGSHDLDWLRSEAQKEPGSPPFEQGEAVVDDGSPPGEVKLPDWLRPVGESEREEERATTPPLPFTDGDRTSESGALPESTPPERPAWLAPDEAASLWRDSKAELAPAEGEEESRAAGTAPLASRTPAPPSPPEQEPSAEAEPAETPQGDGSEWLKRLPSQPSSPAEMETPAWLKSEAFGSTESDETEKPEWLRPASEEAPAEIGEIPDWLKAAGRVLPTPPPEPAAQDESAPETPAPAGMPDWLRPVGAEEQPPPPIPKIAGTPPTEAEKPRAGEAPGWLLELASQTAAEPMPEPEPASELPAWLDERQPGASDTISRWLGQNTPTGEGEAPATEEPAEGEIPSWMRAMAQEPGAPGNAEEEFQDTGQPAEAATATAPAAEPTMGDMPAPDWIKAAMGEVESEVSSVFPGEGGMPAPAAEPSGPVTPPAPIAAAPVEPATPAPLAQPAQAAPEPRPSERIQAGLGAPVPARPAIPVKPPAPAVPPVKVPRSVPMPPPEMGEEPPPASAPEPGTWVPLEPAPARRPPPPAAPEPAPFAAAAQKMPPAMPEPKPKPKRAPKRKPARLTHAESEAIIAEARSQMNTGRVAEAVRSYQRVLESGDETTLVAADLERAVENKPLVAELWQTLGDACQRAGKLDRAYQAYEKALTLL